MPFCQSAASTAVFRRLRRSPKKTCGYRSKRARAPAYRLDVQHLMTTLGISTLDKLRQADHKAVIAWERYMREVEGAATSTIRRGLAALSSLFRHLIDCGAQSSARSGTAGDQPAGRCFRRGRRESCSTRRPRVRSPACAIVRCSRWACGAEIAALGVGDLHQNRGFDPLRVTRKGGRRDALAINPQTAARLRAYIKLAAPLRVAVASALSQTGATQPDRTMLQQISRRQRVREN
jgi:integrase/recombinase XerD